MDYKDSLNLPKTSFKMKANLKQKEPEMLKKWDKMNIEKYVRENRKDAPKFLLHDGPPYANGDIHMGHALNKVLKDVVIKYKTMQGFNAPYVPGWDTHGLPIEHKVTTELGEKAEQLSKVQLRKICKDYALKQVKKQKKGFQRLGVRGEWENPYLTLIPEYEAGVLNVLKSLVESGNVYRNKKPIYWCSECQTALAEAEVEYHDHSSPSIFVKFELEKNTYIVIWTTTPWTLPANVAIALHEKFEYSKVKVNNEYWIMATELVDKVMKTAKIENYEIVEKFLGKEMEGKKAKHPFIDRDSLIVFADYVTLEDGTGCVHTAPGHGAEDYQTGLKYKLPVISPVDEKGFLTEEAGKYAGLKIWDANSVIIKDLEASGHLVAVQKIKHSYPHCWRCKSPIIFRATEQWFVSVDNAGLRQKVLDEIKEVNWIPEWGENRITSMIADRPDWCISRQRSWGIPIPAVRCVETGEVVLTTKMMDQFINIVSKEGTDAWFKKELSEIFPEGIDYDKGSTFEKMEDILDVWIDSGASFESVVNSREELNKFPVDLYLEGSDQHRGWFNSSIFLSVAKYGKAPYKSVLTHGFIKDESGKKMSKSIGNVISPQEIIDQYGADILRLWVSSADYRGDIKISFDILKQQAEVYRKFRNTIRFLLGNIADFSPKNDYVEYKDMEEIDKWALLKLNKLIETVTNYYESYEFYKVHQALNKFCTIDMSSIYLDIIKDRLYTESTKSKLRRSAQTAMYEIAIALTKMMAPILTFTGEEIYLNLPEEAKTFETVQLEKWPEIKEEYNDKKLEEKWNKLLEMREEIMKALEEKRKNKEIGHSLETKVVVEAKSKEYEEILKSFDTYFLADSIIASQFEIGKVENGFEGNIVKVKVTKAEGKKCERCWKIDTEVGNDSEYTDVCPRCAAVLKGER
ncbi:isoleucine--tRNA ligase [Tepiditoga spiralis]|uniref:Isoleucine--tRNA ligase n=1 Tax=Tepiditoga spiralis TaxID=2108365 RepID=A0A7G1G9G6_9BACT|nr:isoleucine--tRNA ligase [Tepiditoga spiralis]BBE30692.1 isoleucine--tRNA ligase [Tepiditoga spiralis]